MKIRALGPKELWKCYEGAKNFFDEGKLPGSFVAESFQKGWKGFIENKFGVVFGLFEDDSTEIPAGGIGGIIYPDVNDGQMVAMECFWYVNKDRRGEGVALLDVFESWVAVRGAKRIIMVHLTGLMDERLKKFYERRGYRELETHFVKEI